MGKIKLGDSYEETIAPAHEVLGYSKASFSVLVDGCLSDMTKIFTSQHKFFSAGMIKEISKLDYPEDIKLWCLFKLNEIWQNSNR